MADSGLAVHNSYEMPAGDVELLQEFVRRKSDAAFAQIVRRYTNLVYAAARRQVGDTHLARDVTQAVFIVLAQKAASAPGNYLAAWLLNTARLCSRDAIKKRTRRLHYEREAAMAKSEVIQPDEPVDLEIAAWLDDALSRLRRRDCTAVAMRYLQDQPVATVAAAIGVTPNAAQKILSRSLSKIAKILRRKGVAIPSIAPLAALLVHQSAQSAPASLVVSPSSWTPSGLSIAKGVTQMMRWTKIKIAALIAATVTLAAGTGSFVLTETRAETPVPAPSAAANPAQPATPASIAPFDSPFLELVGCRIKEPVLLRLAATPPAPAEAAWVGEQYPLVRWTLEPDLAARVNQYAISVVPRDDPAAVQTIQADKSAVEQPLLDQSIQPGEYTITVSALAADAQTIASASVHAVVAPLPYTQIMIVDIAADGACRFVYVDQARNDAPVPQTESQFIASDFVHTEKMTDGDGNPLQFTAQHDGQIYRYRCEFQTPIQPGDVEFMSNSGTETGVVHNQGNETFMYSLTHTPGGIAPTRRVELYRLPRGATLLYSTGNLRSKVVGGQTQIFLDTTIPQGGKNTVAFRYRLASH